MAPDWGKSILATSLLLLQSATPWDCDRAPVTSWQRWRYGKDCKKKGKKVAKMEKVASGPSATPPLPYHEIEPRDLIKPVVLNSGAGNESTAIAVCFTPLLRVVHENGEHVDLARVRRGSTHDASNSSSTCMTTRTGLCMTVSVVRELQHMCANLQL